MVGKSELSTNVRAESEANRRHGFGRLGLQSSLSLQPFEGSRFVRGGRYGISVDFGWEVIEKAEYLGADLRIELHRSNHGAQAHDRLIVTGDGPFCKTDCHFRISDVDCSEHAIASAQSGFVQTGFSEVGRIGAEKGLDREMTAGHGRPG